MDDKKEWALNIRQGVEEALRVRGITEFLLIGVNGENVVAIANRCDCLVAGLAGGFQTYPELKLLVVQALRMADGEQEEQTPIIMH